MGKGDRGRLRGAEGQHFPLVLLQHIALHHVCQQLLLLGLQASPTGLKRILIGCNIVAISYSRRRYTPL